MNDLLLSLDGQVNASANNQFPYYIFKTKESLDVKTIAEAVNEAMELHPVFHKKIIKKKGLFYLTDNNLKVLVEETDLKTSIYYNNKNNNYYPWIITVHENQLIFTCAHAICDGSGAVSFLKDVLTIYFIKKGKLNKSCLVIPNKDELLRRIENSFDIEVDEKSLNPLEIKMKGKVEKLPKNCFESDINKIKRKRYLISKDILSEKAKETGTSTFAIVSAALSKALATTLKLEKGYVKIMLPVNLRRYFDSVTDLGFVKTLDLLYDVEKLKDRDVYYGATVFRTQLDVALDKDNLTYHLWKDKKTSNFMKKFPPFVSVAKLAFLDMLYSPKASIVYTHLTDLGINNELDELIEDFEIGGNNKLSPLMVVIASTYKGKVSLVFSNCIKDDILYKEFEKALSEYDINYDVEISYNYPAFNLAK